MCLYIMYFIFSFFLSFFSFAYQQVAYWDAHMHHLSIHPPYERVNETWTRQLRRFNFFAFASFTLSCLDKNVEIKCTHLESTLSDKRQPQWSAFAINIPIKAFLLLEEDSLKPALDFSPESWEFYFSRLDGHLSFRRSLRVRALLIQ